MKILLFGEFSGLHNNLKNGLVKLGHKVVIAAGKDGYKDIGNDINLDPSLPGLLGMLESRLKPFVKISELSGYDIVQTINPFFPNAKLFPKLAFYNLLSKLNNKFFMLAAGSDAYWWKHSREKLKYGPFEDFLKYDIKSNNFYMQSNKAYSYNTKILNMVDGVIPIMHEYEVAYSNSSKRLTTIPLPINIESVKFTKNIVKKKIVIFHGLSRYGFKGTRHVEEAFSILRKAYPNDLELIIAGQLPLKEYLKIMQKTNVVIDQTSSYSLGMNGIYALAMGKVVLGGAEPEGLKSLGIKNSPVINITPSKESIILAIEGIIERKKFIEEMGYESRLFAINEHCSVKVAQKYVDTWV
jgi:hypothetical protein